MIQWSTYYERKKEKDLRSKFEKKSDRRISVERKMDNDYCAVPVFDGEKGELLVLFFKIKIEYRYATVRYQQYLKRP